MRIAKDPFADVSFAHPEHAYARIVRTVQAILAEAEAIDWALWDVQPPDRLWDYQPASVPAALASVTGVRSKSDADRAYNRIMDALGHNHSATPYPAMVAGARLLAELVPLVRGWQAVTVVDVLTDCYLWTQGEAEIVTKDGRTYDPGAETAQAVRSVLPALEALREDDEPSRLAAAELLEVLDRGTS